MNLVLSFRIIGYFRNINCLLGDSQQLANPNQGELGSCDDGGEFVVSCPLPCESWSVGGGAFRLGLDTDRGSLACWLGPPLATDSIP